VSLTHPAVAAAGGEDEHAGDASAWAEMVEQEAAGDLHGGEAEEEGTGKRAQGFRPDGEVAHQIEADGNVGGTEEMAGHIGCGQRGDDDQAPAVGEGAPLGRLHRWGMFRFLLKIARPSVLGG
jgi:hypothetical protein